MNKRLLYILALLFSVVISISSQASVRCSDIFISRESSYRSIIEELIPDNMIRVYETDFTILNAGRILDNQSLSSLEPGLYSFIVAASGSNKGKIIIGDRHSDLGESKVYAAGELVVVNKAGVNEIDSINAKSGTFMPGVEIIRPTLEALWEVGIFPENFTFNRIDNSSNFITFQNGQMETSRRFQMLLRSQTNTQ